MLKIACDGKHLEREFMVYGKCYREYTRLPKAETVRYLKFHIENANTKYCKLLINTECYTISMITRVFQKKPVDIPKRKCFAKRLLKKIYHKIYRVFILSIISICIKKLYKSIPVTTFVGGIKNFAKQDNTCEKWVLSRSGQAEYVAGLKEVTRTYKSSQNPMEMLTVI